MSKSRANRHKALEARRRKNRRERNQQRTAALHPEKAAAPLKNMESPATAPEPEKRKRTPKARPAWRYHAWVWNLLFFLTPLLVIVCGQSVTLESIGGGFAWLVQFPGPAAFTYLLLLALELVLVSCTASLLAASLILGLPTLLMTIISHFKEIVNGVPLMVSDLAMAGRVGDVVGFMRPGMSWGKGTLPAIGLLLLLVALIVLFARRPREKKHRWQARLVTGLAAALVLVGSAFLPPARAFLDGPGEEIQAERNDRLGFLAGFYSGFLDSAVQPPDAYNENHMNSVLVKVQSGAKRTTAPSVQPNVVMLMSESFCDPKAILPGVEFKEDPIPNFRAMELAGYTGYFLSNTYGGGTGNVEMEVMTGIPIGFLGEGEDLTSLKDETAYDRVPSIIKAFAEEGYATEFIHSYTDRLYNRADNFPRIGFETVLFETDFPEDAPREAGYLSDLALTDKMIEEFENRDRNKPLLLYGLSMENHQPYYTGKFDTPSGLDYSTAGTELDEDGEGAVDALLHGIYDADAALGKLLDYFESCGEPVIVIFWGDHLPGLSLNDEGSVYETLGYTDSTNTKNWTPQQLKQMHTTRYLVWNNYGAELDTPETVSATTLGSHILGWAGVPKPLYFQWVDAAQRDMLLYRQRLFITADGTPSYTPPDTVKKTVETYHSIVYDLIYGEGYIADTIVRVPKAK